jgi:hypothetical protein
LDVGQTIAKIFPFKYDTKIKKALASREAFAVYIASITKPYQPLKSASAKKPPLPNPTAM